MTTAPATDPAALAHAGEPLRATFQRLAALARQDNSEADFARQLIESAVSALGAGGGVFWRRGADGLTIPAEVNLRATGPADNAEQLAAHRQLVESALTAEGPRAIAPQPASNKTTHNPTDHVILFAPVRLGQEAVALLEVFQRPTTDAATQRGDLKFLHSLAEIAAEHLRNRRLAELERREAVWRRWQEFAAAAHGRLALQRVAAAVANEGRRLIECDRLSVVIRRGRRDRLIAISGQETFDHRANLVRALERLVTRVLATGQPLAYDGAPLELAPQLEEVLEAYLDQSHTKQLLILPLAPRESADNATQPPPCGALVAEQLESAQDSDVLRTRLEPIAAQATLAVANALEHERVFLLPVWRAIGRSRVLVASRHLPKTVLVAAGAIATALALLLLPAPLLVHSPGRLQPVVRRDVFAAADGTVERVLVDHGQRVASAQIVAELRNTDLDVAIADITGQQAAAAEQLSSVGRALHDELRELTAEERTRLAGQRAELSQKLDSLREQRELLLAKRARLQLRSPIDGEVTTWNIRELLDRRPVAAGQALMSVADVSGPWELELRVPDYRIGHLLAAAQQANEPLRVTFRLATEPGTDFQGTVREIKRTAEVHEDDGNTVLVRVAVDRDALGSRLRPGADVIAKVDCGRTSLGYAWLHDVVGFIQAKIIFKLF